MTDAEYVFRQDVADKKCVGRSAQKKNRTGKGHVRFPSDYLSRKERSAMNGDVKSYNLHAPMTYEEFRIMPDDLQRDYLKMIDKQYNVPASAIAGMFGVSETTVFVTRKRLGVHNPHCSRSSSAMQRWGAFVQDVQDVALPPESVSASNDPPPSPDCAGHKPVINPGFSVAGGNIQVVSTPQELVQMLSVLCGTTRRRFTIEIGGVDESA
jgi:hypothetical protein